MEAAYRRRMGLVGLLYLCRCDWPVMIEPTSTGHAEYCTVHARMERMKIALEPDVNPYACCARDVDGVGSCDIHSAQGVLRKRR